MTSPTGIITGASGGAAGGLWPAGLVLHRGLDADFLLSPPAAVEDVLRQADIVLLVLPEAELLSILPALRGAATSGTVLVSTCPTVSLRTMRSLVGNAPALFRAVVPPGTEPGEAIAALAAEQGAPGESIDRVKTSLAWIGAVELVSEDALDAVAAVALGGAAFLCAAIDGLEEGAVSQGLPRETARPFAHQTALATALLLRDHLGSPADLKDQVASPGGTTIAALGSLEDAGIRGAFFSAVQRSAAKVRARRDAARSGVIE